MDLPKTNLKEKIKFKNSPFRAMMDKDPQRVDTEPHYNKCGSETSIRHVLGRICKMGIVAFLAVLRIRDVYAGSEFSHPVSRSKRSRMQIRIKEFQYF
jgi:hypothetical protein